MQHTNANPISRECIKSNKNKMIRKEPFETFQTPPKNNTKRDLVMDKIYTGTNNQR